MHISLSENKEKWNEFVLKNSSDEFLQSWEWGDFQKSYGRKVWHFAIKEGSDTIAQAVTICMKLPAGKSYVYVPRGPVWKHGRSAESADSVWSLFTQNWRLIGLESNAFFASFEPGLKRPLAETTEREVTQKYIKERNWKKTKQIQPEYVGVVNLERSEETILSHMHQKTRYNIRLSEKKDLTIEQKNDKEGLQIFWDMLQETAKRDKISIYPFSYYRKMYTIFYEKSERISNSIPIARIFIIRGKNGTPLSSALMILFGNTAYYLYGASSNTGRNRMSNYYMQWHIMKWCKYQEIKYYDMGGIAEPHAPRDHSWSGVTRFKKGFGADNMQYPGTFTYPYHRGWYRVYTIAKWIKRKLR